MGGLIGDQRFPIRPPTSTHSSPNKKTLKDKQKSKLKLQETENIETLKSRQLEKNGNKKTASKKLKLNPKRINQHRVLSKGLLMNNKIIVELL